MTHRLASTLVWAVVFLIVVSAVAGCARGSSSSTTSSTPAAASLAPTPADTALARSDPAVWAAVRFEQAYCTWDWRQPQASYVAEQQQLATPQFAAELAAAADPVSWREEVVAGHQQVTCTVSQAQRLVGAPSTASTVYVRMEVDEQVTSTMGSFDVGQKVASWRVGRRGGQWLVAGSFEGG